MAIMPSTACAACGAAAGYALVTCYECGGSGRDAATAGSPLDDPSPLASAMFAETGDIGGEYCGVCGGSGQILQGPCSGCGAP